MPKFTQQQQSSLLNDLVVLLAVISIAAFIVSLLYVREFGFSPDVLFEITAAIFMGMICIFRQSIRNRYKFWMINVIILGVVFVDLARYGLLGSGAFILLALLNLLHITVYGKRALYIGVVIILVILAVVSYGWISGHLVSDMHINEYLASPMAWIYDGLMLFCALMLVSKFSISMLSEKVQLLQELENQKAELEHLANHDMLTGLPSLRRAEGKLNEIMVTSKRNGTSTALLYLDLDGFKEINDTYGHEAGDSVLKAISDRFSDIIRDTDICCRIGGDEFLIIACDIKQLHCVKDMCERLVAAASAPVEYQGHKLIVGVSIGAALYPDHAQDARTLRLKADEVMYEVKRKGKNNYLIANNLRQ